MKRTKLHGFKKFSRGSMPPNHPSNAHGFAIRDMQIPKSEKKKYLPHPLPNPGTAPVLYEKSLPPRSLPPQCTYEILATPSSHPPP